MQTDRKRKEREGKVSLGEYFVRQVQQRQQIPKVWKEAKTGELLQHDQHQQRQRLSICVWAGWLPNDQTTSQNDKSGFWASKGVSLFSLSSKKQRCTHHCSVDGSSTSGTGGTGGGQQFQNSQGSHPLPRVRTNWTTHKNVFTLSLVREPPKGKHQEGTPWVSCSRP